MLCDFLQAKERLRGFEMPEMIKRRPVAVLATPVYGRCVVVCFSTTKPDPIMPWHHEITWSPLLPSPYDKSSLCWTVADHVYTVAYARLNLFFTGKDAKGNRIYDKRYLTSKQLEGVRSAVRLALSL